MDRQMGLLVLCWCLTACGSSSDTGGGQGGGGTSTGGADQVAGAGGGGVPGAGAGGSSNSAGAGGGMLGGGPNGSTVRGAVSVNIQAPAGCALAAQSQDFPIVTGGHPVTASEKGAGIANRDVDSSGAAAHVYCTWFSDTSPYQINAGLMLGPAGNRRSVDLGSQLSQGMSSVGSMGFQSTNQPESAYGGVCTFTVIEVDPGTRSVWGSFTCDSLTDSMSSPTGCAVGPSYFFFENCTKP